VTFILSRQGIANPADWMLDVVIKSQPGIVATLVEAFEVSRVIAGEQNMQ
jgi:hypothetical protein